MVKIVDYELFKLPPRFLLLRLETERGITGWGEPTVEGHNEPVSSAVRNFIERYVFTKEIDSIEDVWQQMYRSSFYRGGPILMSAIAGIDQALWDIKGKIYDAPVYELFGGKSRNKLRAHRWIGGSSPDQLIEEAQSANDEGFSAVKMHAIPKMKRIDSIAEIERAKSRLAAVREAVGTDLDIAIDFHGRASKSMAKRLVAVLEEYHPLFFEEPILSEYNETLPQIAEHTSIPIATGERLYSRWDFKRILGEGFVDIVQPSICHAGGISEVRKIADMAESYDVGFAPIYPGSPVSFTACLQVGTYAPNFVIQHYGQITDSIPGIEHAGYSVTDDGYLTLSDRPGLGISFDVDAVREHSMQSLNWQNPRWRHEDGSIAEW